MLSKNFIYTLKTRYCVDDYTQIEGFWEAYNDDLPSRKHCLHHKYEIVLDKTPEQLDYMGLYEHRYARELQIMLRSDHSKLHNTGKNNGMYGRTGNDHPNFGKTAHNKDKKRYFNEETQKYYYK